MKDIYNKVLDNLELDTNKLKLVLWIGAGVDIKEPTALPSGIGLTNFLLQYAYPLNTYKKNNSSLYEIYGKPRLESVIECFLRLENSILEKESQYFLLNGFKSFWERNPNENHYILAELLERGANIVTTNYDRCVPLAYQEIYNGKELELCSFGTTKGYYCFENRNNEKSCGKIYHIHGVAADIGTLGATLNQLKNGLDEIFCEQMKYWLEEEYTFIFLGYGGGDSLDVNPFFKSLEKYANTSGIYVRHAENYEEIISRTDYKEEEKTLLNCFGLDIVYAGDTTKFLVNLSLEREMIRRKQEGVVLNWEHHFRSMCKEYDYTLRLAMAVQLCYSLGISPNRILPYGWWRQFVRITNIQPWYIRYYGFAVGRMIKKRRVIRYFKPTREDGILFQSDYWTVFHKYKRAAIVFGRPAQILVRLMDIVIRREKIDWYSSTALNRWFDYFLIEIIHKPHLYERNIVILREEVSHLEAALEIVLHNKELVEDIFQYYTALRAHTLIRKIFKDDDSCDILLEEVLNSYKSVSSTSGILGTLSLMLISESVSIKKNFLKSDINKVYLIVREMICLIKRNAQYYYLYHLGHNILFFLLCLLESGFNKIKLTFKTLCRCRR